MDHFLSRVMHGLARVELPLIKRVLINLLVKLYAIDVSEAEEQNLDNYKSFNDFFTRKLQHGARPINSDDNAITSPVDGVVGQLGNINDGVLIQAKGRKFTVTELLGGDQELSNLFAEGSFNTTYLAPSNYHRIHMPITGTLQKMIHVPGRLFPVNKPAVNNIDRLFARNERVVAVFDSEYGKVAMVLVGALFVGSIETVWAGEVTPPTRYTINITDYPEDDSDKELTLQQGEEMGRFNMGSTVITLFANSSVKSAENLLSGSKLKMGEKIAS